MAQTTHVVTAFLRREGRLLVLRRSNRVGSYRGCWAAVSGHLESADPLAQALREVAEETGIDARRLQLVAAGVVLEVAGTSPDRRWVVHPFLFDLEGSAEPRLDWEHVAYRWVAPAELRGLHAVPRLVDALRACWPDAPGLDGEVPAD